MKTPFDTIKGRVVGYDEKRGELLIRAKYVDVYTLFKRDYKTCLVQLTDNRPLSDKQRRACYALINEIADFSGEHREREKTQLKLMFLSENIQDIGDKIFSLSDAPMSLVCAFQRYLVDFIVANDIPCSFPLLDMVDDVSDYVYSCLVNKKCCVCGRHADLHHTDHVGMGRDRTEIIHEGMNALPLCREHHDEAHRIGQMTFEEKYHINHGVALDKTLCRIYGLKRRKENAQSH